MERKKCSYIFLMMFFLICAFNCKFNFVRASDSYMDKGIKLDVQSRKTWKINFNAVLNATTINNNNVFVKDQYDKTIATTVSLSNDKKSILVSPKDEYKSGETYTLFITNSVLSVNGKKLIKSAKMKFKIKDKVKENKDYTIVIDAGRGGYDVGNVSPLGLREKSINLSVALKLGNILKNNGINVVYTRSSDNVSWNEQNDLEARLDVAKKSNADYLISIHCNGYVPNPDARGIETYYQQWDNASKKLSQDIQSNLIASTKFKDRGIKEAGIYHDIIRGTSSHAVLVELGFITNEEESVIMGSNEFQTKASEALAKAILKNLSLNKEKSSHVKTVSNINETINSGEEYYLPATVEAVMDDGTLEYVGIVWDTHVVDTSKSGTYTYKGFVPGYTKEVTLTLNIKANNSSISQTPDRDYVPTPSRSNTICIDAGHGLGQDTGATGVGGIREDDVTLNVALKVGKILEDKGVDVVYTRKTDMRSQSMSVKESLQKRCDISNNAGARYFVCIHCNSYNNSSPNGTETFYCTSNDESKRLATNIQNNIVREVGTYNRGIKDGNWLYVIKHTDASAVLTELGFLTNSSDASKLNSEDYTDKYAKAIANGILETMGKM